MSHEPSAISRSGRFSEGDLLAVGDVGLEVGLVDAVTAELLADAPPRQTAVRRTAVDPAAVALQDALEVRALDPLGQLIGDDVKWPPAVEVEAERLFAGRHDLRRQILGLDDRAGGRDGHLLDDMLQFADV